MSSPRLQVVLFDWDGTLVDSARATFHCYTRLFESYGIPYDRRRFEETYAPDWYHTYRLLGLPERVWREADALWLRLYAQEPTPPVDGAAQTLARLAHAGLRQGLVTSGDRRRVEGELGALGFDRYIQTLVCAGEAERPKPAPDPLLVALARLDAAPESAAFVGDSPEDVQMARAAGVYAVGIPGGFPNRDALLRSRPNHLAESLVAAADHLLAECGLSPRPDRPAFPPSVHDRTTHG